MGDSFLFSVRLCGNQLPAEPIISTGSRMLLTYKTSEHSPLHTGFLAAYEGITEQLIFLLKGLKSNSRLIARSMATEFS